MFATIGGFSLTYSILGTLCCVGLLFLVIAAIVFAALLYRRRRSAQLLAMRAMLQQQALEPSYQDDEFTPTLEQQYPFASGSGGSHLHPHPELEQSEAPDLGVEEENYNPPESNESNIG